jgi:hypothetical protein
VARAPSWSSATCGRPYPCTLFPRCHDPRDKPFCHRYLTSSPCSSLLPCAFAAATLMSFQHCAPQATGHLVTRAPPSSLSEVVLKPHLQLSPLRRPPQSKPKMSTFFRRGRLNIDRTSLATPDPPCYAAELRACATLLHVPSAGAFDHPFIPLVVVPHRRPTLPWAVCSSETPSSRRPKSETRWPGLGPRPIPHRSSAVSWSYFVGDHRRQGGGKSPVLGCRGPKGLMDLTAPVDEAQ